VALDVESLVVNEYRPRAHQHRVATAGLPMRTWLGWPIWRRRCWNRGVRSGRASVTAQAVAQYRATMERVPASYGDPEAERRLCADIGRFPWAERWNPLYTYLTARTWFFDEQVVAALSDGVAQVVILGAGYDGRPLRYAKPGVRFFEVDHPDTQRDKRDRLSRLGAGVDHITFVAADFVSDDLGEALASAGHVETVPTLFCCEGVTMYLERPVLVSMFGAAARRAAKGSRLAVNFRIRTTQSVFRAVGVWAVSTWAGAMGEPHVAPFAPADVTDLLGSASWQVADGSDTVDTGFVLARPA
jgi:methyltransferase (TIGR00027 family)